MEFSASLDHIDNREGVLETQEAELGWPVELQSGDELSFEFTNSFERLFRPFRIRGGAGRVPAGDYRFNEFSMRH